MFVLGSNESSYGLHCTNYFKHSDKWNPFNWLMYMSCCPVGLTNDQNLKYYQNCHSAVSKSRVSWHRLGLLAVSALSITERQLAVVSGKMYPLVKKIISLIICLMHTVSLNTLSIHTKVAILH